MFGGVYKLVAVEDKDGNVVPKIKISENVGKITTPHFKKLYRFYGRDTGKAIADYLCVYDETVDDSDNHDHLRPRGHLEAQGGLSLRGAASCSCRSSKTASWFTSSLRSRRSAPTAPQQVDTLWDEVKRFDNPHRYYVDLSQKLYDIKQELLTKNGSH